MFDSNQKRLFKKYELMYAIRMENLVYYQNPDAGISDDEYKYTHEDHPHLFFVWYEDSFNGSCCWSVELIE
jgi:hypothetical protein